MSAAEHLRVKLKKDLGEEFIHPDLARTYAQSYFGSSKPLDASMGGWIYKTLGEKIFAEAGFYTVATFVEKNGIHALPTLARLRFADWLTDEKDFETSAEFLSVPVLEQEQNERAHQEFLLGKLQFRQKKYVAAVQHFKSLLELANQLSDQNPSKSDWAEKAMMSIRVVEPLIKK